MKKIIALLFAAVLTLNLTACGSSATTGNSAATGSNTEAASSETTDNSTADEEKNAEPDQAAEEETPSAEETLPSGTVIELNMDNYLDYLEWKDYTVETEKSTYGVRHLVIKEGYYWDQDSCVNEEAGYIGIPVTLYGAEVSDGYYRVNLTRVYKDGSTKPCSYNIDCVSPSVWYDKRGDSERGGDFFMTFYHSDSEWWDIDDTEEAYNNAYMNMFGKMPGGYEVFTPFKVIDVKGRVVVE